MVLFLLETSAVVRPVLPEVAKQFLENYYQRLEERSRLRIQQLKKKKKRAISFSQADHQRVRKPMLPLELSRVGGHSRRMSVDVNLLLGQSKTLLCQQSHSSPPKGSNPVTGADNTEVTHLQDTPNILAAFPAKAKKMQRKKWKTVIMRRFVSEPAYTTGEEGEDEEVFQMEDCMDSEEDGRPDTPRSPLLWRWSWSKKHKAEIKRSSSFQVKQSLTRQGSLRQCGSEFGDDLVIGNPSHKLSFSMVANEPVGREVCHGWPQGRPTRHPGHKRRRRSSLPEPVLCRLYTDSHSMAWSDHRDA